MNKPQTTMLKNLTDVSAHELLAEIRTVRQRVSDYTDEKRSQLVALARGTINAHAKPKVSSRR